MPSEELEPVQLDDQPEHLVYIGSKLAKDIRCLLIHFLKQNMEVFAWKQEDMGGIDPTVITHRLNVSPSFKSVKQKRRSFALKRQKVINEEVIKLLLADAIREVDYPKWLVNVALVKKANANGDFASISQISTGSAQKTAFHYLGLMSSWTPQPVMNSSASWTLSLAITRSVWITSIKRIPHSSLGKEPIAIG